MNRIIQIIQVDELRLNALQCVRTLNLPQCFLAAGFVRNLVWDHLHDKIIPTTLNDIDVIYFDLNEASVNKYIDYELALKRLMPNLNWQVRNQAIIHTRNNDKPYTSTLHAMSYWPEKETAIAIRMLDSGLFECISAFGFDSLFNLQMTYNPKRSKQVFDERIKSKKWLTHWPKLQVTP